MMDREAKRIEYVKEITRLSGKIQDLNILKQVYIILKHYIDKHGGG